MEPSNLKVLNPCANPPELLKAELLPAVEGAMDWIRNVMLPAPDGSRGVWERVRINLNQLQYWVRPDCTSETARACMLFSAFEGHSENRTLARNLLSYLQSRQLPIGAFPFYHFAPPDASITDPVAGGAGLWPNDNGKVLGVLTELASVFSELGIEASAVSLGEYFLANQRPEGWWTLDGTDYPGTCFVTWPVTGLSRLWRLTGQERFRVAALRGLAYLKTLQLPDGRMRTSYEINGVENWRPVSSETAMALFALAITQECLELDLSAPMLACGDFLLSLIGEDGGVRNCNASCLEASEQNNPDLADMVYTNGYALQALIKTYDVLGQARYFKAARDLARFLARIRCQGESPLWDGAWRGSYDVVKGEWSGRADQQNELDEGGMYSVYTGWCTMPIVTGLLMTLDRLGRPRDSD